MSSIYRYGYYCAFEPVTKGDSIYVPWQDQKVSPCQIVILGEDLTVIQVRAANYLWALNQPGSALVIRNRHHKVNCCLMTFICSYPDFPHVENEWNHETINATD